MGREYKHSVKNSLTRKLVMIIIASVSILFSMVVLVQMLSADKQSERAKESLI